MVNKKKLKKKRSVCHLKSGAKTNNENIIELVHSRIRADNKVIIEKSFCNWLNDVYRMREKRNETKLNLM